MNLLLSHLYNGMKFTQSKFFKMFGAVHNGSKLDQILIESDISSKNTLFLILKSMQYNRGE